MCRDYLKDCNVCKTHGMSINRVTGQYEPCTTCGGYGFIFSHEEVKAERRNLDKAHKYTISGSNLRMYDVSICDDEFGTLVNKITYQEEDIDSLIEEINNLRSDLDSTIRERNKLFYKVRGCYNCMYNNKRSKKCAKCYASIGGFSKWQLKVNTDNE